MGADRSDITLKLYVAGRVSWLAIPSVRHVTAPRRGGLRRFLARTIQNGPWPRATRIRIVIRRLFLLVALLIALGFGAGVYVGLVKTNRLAGRPAPAAVKAPAAPVPRVGPETKRVEPAAPPPVERPARRAPVAGAEPAPAPAAAPRVGLLTITSDVAGAQIFIDREFVGTAPVRAHEVAIGAHKVNVSAPGFEGVAETIDVEPGPRELMFKLREVRLDAEIDVIHKHRMGSCTGRLVATPQGMRYETSDRSDRFDVALSDFETLEVDYLKKNLKLKIRKGRSFDFTDPEGNADHLFVFHRDVVKARERLLKGDPPATP